MLAAHLYVRPEGLELLVGFCGLLPLTQQLSLQLIQRLFIFLFSRNVLMRHLKYKRNYVIGFCKSMMGQGKSKNWQYSRCKLQMQVALWQACVLMTTLIVSCQMIRENREGMSLLLSHDCQQGAMQVLKSSQHASKLFDGGGNIGSQYNGLKGRAYTRFNF